MSSLILTVLSTLPLGAWQNVAAPAHSGSKQSTANQISREERLRAFLGLGPPPDPAAAERGGKLYASSCAFCHGAKATGGEGPDLVRSTLVLHDEKGELIAPVILKGRPEKGMPGFASLSEAQAGDIAAFLHMRVELAANRGLYRVQNVVTGNVKAGQAYFDGPGRCNTCHSPAGDLAHIGSKYQPADLQAAFLYPASVARSERGAPPRSPPVHVKVTLPSGQSFTGIVKRLDDFVVSLYDSSGQYHSWTRSGVTVEFNDPLAVHRQLLDHYTDSDMHNLLAYLVTLK